MLSCRLIVFSFLLLACFSTQAQQRDIALLAASCAACHGYQGRSVGGMPSLAGLDSLYFIKQMQLFQRGERSATVMMRHALGYTEEEIRLLADYFAAQK